MIKKIEKEAFLGPHNFDKLEDRGDQNYKKYQETANKCGCAQGTLKESEIHIDLQMSNPFLPWCFRNFPRLCFAMKLMGVHSYLGCINLLL